MKTLRRICFGGLILYVASLAFGLWFEIFPREVREHDGKRYEIRRGFGFSGVFIPGLVLFVIGDEPCRLVIVDKATGKKEVISHDIPDDIYEDHPDVWPEKARGRTG